TLSDGINYYAKIKSIDNATNESTGVDTAEWTVAGALIATISGEPADPSVDEVLDIDIGGTNVTEYQFKVEEAGSTDCSVSTGYSADVDAGTNITSDISALSDGNITLCVVGGNGTDWQAFADASTVTWEKDTTAPINTSIAINGTNNYTNDDDVTLTLAAD